MLVQREVGRRLGAELDVDARVRLRADLEDPRADPVVDGAQAEVAQALDVGRPEVEVDDLLDRRDRRASPASTRRARDRRRSETIGVIVPVNCPVSCAEVERLAELVVGVDHVAHEPTLDELRDQRHRDAAPPAIPVRLNVPRQLELGERAGLTADEAAALDEHVLAEARLDGRRTGSPTHTANTCEVTRS